MATATWGATFAAGADGADTSGIRSLHCEWKLDVVVVGGGEWGGMTVCSYR